LLLSPHKPPRPLASREAAALDRQLETVANPELRDALARLGRLVIGAAG
jgi:hypothetical protein